ncbi:tryptophan-rich sensory protein [Chloroflexota bacterium]
MKDIVRQVVVVLSTIAVIVVNGLASALPLNGLTTGEISDRFEVYFVPAGYVFAIWGLIYLALLGYSIYQALPSQRENPRLRRIGYLYALSCVANITWLFMWHYEVFELTVVTMIALLLLLVAVYLTLGTGRSSVSSGETWLVRVPFSIYLGWVTVATIANVTSLLEYLNWMGWGIAPEVWAVIMLVAAAIIALAVGLTRGDLAFVLVIVWAFLGVAVKQSDTPLVAIPAAFLAGLVLPIPLLGVPHRGERLATQPTSSEGEGARDRW